MDEDPIELVSGDGGAVGPALRVTNAAGASTFGSAVWNGSQYALCWRDERDGNTEVYFTYLGCP